MANFEWALAQLKAGKKVRQQWWIGDNYIYAKCNRIVYHSVMTGEVNYQAGSGLSCVFEDNWELYDDRPPLDGTFGSAMIAVSQGYTVGRPQLLVVLRLVNGVVKHFDTDTNFTPTSFDIKATDWKYYY